MEPYSEEVKTRTPNQAPNQIKFNISSQGDIKFDAQGVSEWELTDAIAQARKEASEARRSHQELQQLQASNLFWMHVMGGAFATILFFTLSLTLARIASTHFNQPQSGVLTNVR